MYFESHAHYDDRKYSDDIQELMEEMKKEGVKYIVNIGTNINTSKKSIELSEKYDFVYATVGTHPHYAKDMKKDDYKKLENWINSEKKVLAIGEIGLDYHYDYSPRDIQKYVFEKQLEVAKKTNYPAIIHSREACQDVYDIIERSGTKKGVIHAFSGSLDMAKKYIKLGYHIGIGGVVTFKNAKKLVDIVKNIPLESILIETDAPYLTPEPFRGQRNDSKKLKYIAEKIAKIKEMDTEEVKKICFNNAEKFFDLK